MGELVSLHEIKRKNVRQILKPRSVRAVFPITGESDNGMIHGEVIGTAHNHGIRLRTQGS